MQHGGKIDKRVAKTKKAKDKMRYTITLSARDEKMLLRYCAANKISQKVAIKRILNTYLAETLEPLPQDAANQLDLFAPKQMNIFDVNA